MATTSGLTVHVEEALKALESIKPTPVLMSEIGAAISQPIMDYQKRHAPRDTGHTAESVTFNITDVSYTNISVEVGPTTEYAVYLEYGTGVYAEGGGGRKTAWKYKNRFGDWVTTDGMRAQPFVRPSTSDPSVQAEVQNALYDTVNGFVQANWHGKSWKSKFLGLFRLGRK